MILLDTNVLSELVRPEPDPQVLRWLDSHDDAETWICSITVAELKLGVALLPDGKRKLKLGEVTDATIQVFAGLCMAFDSLAAAEYADIMASRRRRGRPMEVEDAQIAAIARSAGLTLATRNVGDFSDIENLKLVNPWGTHEPR